MATRSIPPFLSARSMHLEWSPLMIPSALSSSVLKMTQTDRGSLQFSLLHSGGKSVPFVVMMCKPVVCVCVVISIKPVVCVFVVISIKPVVCVCGDKH